MVTRVYLVGFMASGKSTLGKILAEQWDWSFADTDDWAERKIGKSIEACIESEGELAFRQVEEEVLQMTFLTHKTVIATGGGLPAYGRNMEQMLRHGHVIYLCADADTLFDRIRSVRTPRPLLKGFSDEYLKAEILRLMHPREQFYAQAHESWDLEKMKAIYRGEFVKIPGTM